MKQLELFEDTRFDNPKVALIDYTGKGRADEMWHAAHLLMFTKATRLNMSPDLLADIQSMSEHQKMEELRYMATTIPSSWEFASVTFLISGVSRAAAQQITRTRQASYAMQSQRVTDVSGARVMNPYKPGTAAHQQFNSAVDASLAAYTDQLEDGCAPQDARGLLPMNIHTNLVARYNLRALVDLVTARKSMRTQGEYSLVVHAMEREVLAAWPWAQGFFDSKNQKALDILEQAADEAGIETGTGVGWKIAKAMDLLR